MRSALNPKASSGSGSASGSKRSRRKRVESALGLWALSSSRRLFAGRSAARAEQLGERLGSWVFRLSKKHRHRALENLALAMPELSEQQRFELTRRIFQHFGRVTADFLRGPGRSLAELTQTTTIEGMEHLVAAQQGGKGAILITGHLGNWERLAAYVCQQGFAVSVIARDADQAGTTQLVNQLRAKYGVTVIPRGNATRAILEKLRANEFVGILPDQNSSEAFLPFFGKPCGTVLGPGVLHERVGCPVIPAWCVWTGPQQYRIIIEKPLEPFPEGELKGERMMRAVNASLERIIRRYPEQWLWFHNRWKSAIRKGLI